MNDVGHVRGGGVGVAFKLFKSTSVDKILYAMYIIYEVTFGTWRCRVQHKKD